MKVKQVRRITGAALDPVNWRETVTSVIHDNCQLDISDTGNVSLLDAEYGLIADGFHVGVATSYDGGSHLRLEVMSRVNESPKGAKLTSTTWVRERWFVVFENAEPQNN